MPKNSPPIVPGESPFTGHHWYVGLLAACVGFIYLFWCPVYLWLPWMVLGGLVAADDAWKHHRQKYYIGYLSPYNRLCLWFIKRWQPGLDMEAAKIGLKKYEASQCSQLRYIRRR